MRPDGSNDYHVPESMQWTIGLTATSIDFVNQATEYLQSCADEKTAESVKKLIADVKVKKLVFSEFVDFESYLRASAI
ncbi:MAG: hypothetical protein V1867_04215 [Candidatus Falkowbacteria bacterium]